ncbi:MAG: T9SS type A sorting domain-containing protein, partial [Flavisolibacter sp.]|nr:T9SS type A sorting domain-containing protein [Flavisolibacter sp.]
IQSGNDDWFNNGTAGTGQFVIDTTGAASMMANWLANPASRKLPFYRTMRVPQFSTVNNRVWIDAVYIRDYNGQAGGDSTAFVTSNKNGDSPGFWTGGITSVLDKNDIAEMMIHVRRAGPSRIDSLWFMGGLSLQGTTGNRYFDFELYQTDIFYSRTTGQFTNYGPDMGHTTWEFDQAGNITKPGDVIFSAEYSSSSLTMVQARIWVNKQSLAMTPAGFDWAGEFDGASNSSQFGYASIRPKTQGAYYTGLQSGNNTWAGPFGFVDNGNNIITTYSARQFMEFSVNLSKLGLDPISLLGGDACGLPFRRILVKTRTSTSFTSELKDFIGPFDFFQTPPVEAVADVPLYCGVIGVSELNVTNPSNASVYTWSTSDGNIVSDSVGPHITVNMPGTYIVKQQLLDGCNSHAYDTIVIVFDANCVPMDHRISKFRGIVNDGKSQLSWTTNANQQTNYFDLQRSVNGIDFETVSRMYGEPEGNNFKEFHLKDDFSSVNSKFLYYRIRIRMMAGNTTYTQTIKLNIPRELEVKIYPNPVGNQLQLNIPAEKTGEGRIMVYDASGALLRGTGFTLKEGNNIFQMDVSWLKPGFYLLHVIKDNQMVWKKFIVNRNIMN